MYKDSINKPMCIHTYKYQPILPQICNQELLHSCSQSCDKSNLDMAFVGLYST
jgi:hypothetical protein